MSKILCFFQNYSPITVHFYPCKLKKENHGPFDNFSDLTSEIKAPMFFTWFSVGVSVTDVHLSLDFLYSSL